MPQHGSYPGAPTRGRRTVWVLGAVAVVLVLVVVGGLIAYRTVTGEQPGAAPEDAPTGGPVSFEGLNTECERLPVRSLAVLGAVEPALDSPRAVPRSGPDEHLFCGWKKRGTTAHIGGPIVVISVTRFASSGGDDAQTRAREQQDEDRERYLDGGGQEDTTLGWESAHTILDVEEYDSDGYCGLGWSIVARTGDQEMLLTYFSSSCAGFAIDPADPEPVFAELRALARAVAP